MSPRLRLIIFASTLLVSHAQAEPSHSDEIQAYATLTAIAQIASDRCADVLVNNDMLKLAPGFFHLTSNGEQHVRLSYDLEMKRLAAGFEAVPSLKTWCDTVFRAYGPDGDVVKGLMER